MATWDEAPGALVQTTLAPDKSGFNILRSGLVRKAQTRLNVLHLFSWPSNIKNITSMSHSPWFDEMEENEEDAAVGQGIDFCTMGMFIIDEIHYLSPKPPVYDIMGGAGSYATLGARLFSPPPLSKTVAWIIDKGSDFPTTIIDQISSWSTTCLLRSDPTRLTTRGWNGYDANQLRGFKYTTPKLRLDESALTPAFLLSRSFHLICSPTRCTSLVQSILSKRKSYNPLLEKPLFIWEPVPDLCTTFELINLTNALKYVDICSPNHSELAGLMGDTDLGLDPETGQVDTKSVERACEQLLGSMPLSSYALVIRCGATGCYIAKNGGKSRRLSTVKRKKLTAKLHGGLTPDMDMQSLLIGLLSEERSFEPEDFHSDGGVWKWLPAYFTEKEAESVVDPTGGGNAFLGGLAVALARGEGLIEAAAWGSVAASFAIQQVGMPVLREEEEKETWNGESVDKRLDKFLEKMGRS